MKIVAFQGSPLPSGNTDVLLESALKPIKEAGHEVTLFKLNFMRIKPCQDCGSCDKTGKCSRDDDMLDIGSAIRSAHRRTMASPIFFFGLDAQVKAMIDRCQAFWCEKYLMKQPLPEGPRGRKGLLLLVGGMKKEYRHYLFYVMAKAFFRTVSVPHHETLSFMGVDAKGAILEHPTAISEAREAGRKLVV